MPKEAYDFQKSYVTLTVACLAIVTIFLITSHKTKAEDTQQSSLDSEKAVQKIGCAKRGTIFNARKYNVPNFATILLRLISTKDGS